MQRCGRCGLYHAALNVVIRRGRLVRRVLHDNQRGQQGGGFWSFDCALLDAHPEVKRLVVHDETTGATYATDRETFNQYAVRAVLAGKEQLRLFFRYWTVQTERQQIGIREAEPGQLPLFISPRA